ncbi:hypothetical protein GCM10010510_19390 [Streptomyces anandii JCM 4720]|nr:hypothetical protein GCM10010510_19390 [Streptomyces anandii JCM 4720]
MARKQAALEGEGGSALTGVAAGVVEAGGGASGELACEFELCGVEGLAVRAADQGDQPHGRSPRAQGYEQLHLVPGNALARPVTLHSAVATGQAVSLRGAGHVVDHGPADG